MSLNVKVKVGRSAERCGSFFNFSPSQRLSRVYFPGEAVQGVVVVQSKGTMSHNGIRLVASGRIKLLASGKDQTVLENLGSASEDPLKLLNVVIDVAKEGKLPNGTTELPFEFLLQPDAAAKLCETYHGVYVNVHYTIDVEMKRGFPKSDLQAKTEWMVQIPPEATKKKNVKPPVVVPFDITPESLENVKASTNIFVSWFFFLFFFFILFSRDRLRARCPSSRLWVTWTAQCATLRGRFPAR
jgi:hypothetical protein